MKKLFPLIIFSFIVGCVKPPTACLKSDVTNANVNDTVTFTSCSEGATYHYWQVNNSVVTKIEGFALSNHYAIDALGGTGCKDILQIVFTQPGSYNVKLTTPLLKSGTCGSSEKTWSKATEASVTVTIQ